ncbi:MAG: TlpA family protein disulfide reductase [Acidimicrobiales bacterium]
MLRPGLRAPQLDLADIDCGKVTPTPWTEGPVVLAFFKVTCPVCQMAAPKVAAMAATGARVVAIGEDPAPALHTYRQTYGQDVPTLTEPRPYPASDAYGVTAVPSLFLVGSDGVIIDSVGNWDREAWNRVSMAAGGAAVSDPSDGLPAFRPG